MAAITPATIFPNLTSDGTNITIPITDLAGLTAAEVDPSTGNGAELLRIICETAYTKINALDTANQPTQMRWSKPPAQGITAGVNRQDYTFGFNYSVDATAVNMVAEA
ncbi:MAG: hypothetical protein QNJ42_19095 [Crocosphaera sp.]|nr:hypothetical protein [Crocosphaera sp.]